MLKRAVLLVLAICATTATARTLYEEISANPELTKVCVNFFLVFMMPLTDASSLQFEPDSEVTFLWVSKWVHSFLRDTFDSEIVC